MTICIRCSNSEHTIEFATIKEYIEHEKSGHQIMPKVTQIVANEIKEEKKKENPPVVQPLSPSEPIKPIELSYKFTGQCPNCKNDVRTIEVYAGTMLICTAYCNSCDKTLKQQEVLPLPHRKQDETINIGVPIKKRKLQS